MALGSHTQRSPCNNPLSNPTGEQNEFIGPQDPAKRSDAGSDKAFTLHEAFIPLFVLSTKDLFIKFMKVFVKSTQAWDRKQAEPQK